MHVIIPALTLIVSLLTNRTVISVISKENSKKVRKERENTYGLKYNLQTRSCVLPVFGYMFRYI